MGDADDGEADEVFGSFGVVDGADGRRLDAGVVEQQHRATESFFISYSRGNEDYVLALAAHLRASGLPVWFDRDMAWGGRFPQEIRYRITHALAVIVVMSPDAEGSPWVEREILEGQRHNRQFLPILRSGGPLFLLASSNYFDARRGELPGEHELRQLQAILGQRAVGGSAARSLILPEPIRQVTVASVAVNASRQKLSGFLREGEFEHADILTTSLLLEAVDRLDAGWLRRVDGERICFDLLASIDASWSEASQTSQGFMAQLSQYHGPPDWVRAGSSSDFSALALAFGWKYSAGSRAPRYSQYQHLDHPPGFFPTLRNPQLEQSQSWHDQWMETVMAVHLRLRNWRDRI